MPNMKLSNYIFFIVIICFFACKEKQVKNYVDEIEKSHKDSTIKQANEYTEHIPLQKNEILKRFPSLKETNKFSYYEGLPDSLYQLKNNEVESLQLNNSFPKNNHQYINWFLFGKTESKKYFSLYLFQTLESVCLYQVNYSKKDSSLIQLFLLSEWINPCEETSSTETIKIENKYIQKTENEYEEWDENGKNGTRFVETITTKYQIQESGKIDSLTRTRNLISKKLK